MQRQTVGSNRQTSVAPPGFPGGDTGVPFQRPPRWMDRGAQTWGSTAVISNGAYAPTAAYVPRGPGDDVYGVEQPLKGFRGRIPRTSA
jgi:hypothetical protein